MDAEKAAEELRVIRLLMERPIRFSTMSGLSGVWAGCCALAGAAADGRFWGGQAGAHAWASLGVWTAVLLAALGGTVFLTRLRERRQSMPLWSPVKRRILRTILPPVLASAGLTLALAAGGEGARPLIPAVWMLCYGLALWQVGEFSVVEVRGLGVAFLAAGLACAMFLQPWPLAALAATFGGFHLVYGAIVWARYGG